MRLKDAIVFSWKNLWAHRLRAILTIGSVTIGVASILFLVSLGFGLERVVTDQVANFDTFSIIDIPSTNIKAGKIDSESIDKIKNIANVTEVNEIADLAGRVKLSTQDSTTETVVEAVDPSYFKLSELSFDFGQVYKGESPESIVINKSLASLLGYKDNPDKSVGQEVTLDLVIPEALREKDNVSGPITKSVEKATISGVIDSSQNPVIYMPLGMANNAGVVNRSSLKIKVNDQKNIETVRKSLENIGFETQYVGDTVNQIAQVFSLFRIILGGFGMIALIVASLGTFNTLTISLMERVKEVALLKTLGMTKKGIFRIFIVESFTIGIMGGLIGVFLGSTIGFSINTFLTYLANKSDAQAVTIYYSPFYFILLVGASSLIIGFLTGIYPAYRAIKISPLDALRYE